MRKRNRFTQKKKKKKRKRKKNKKELDVRRGDKKRGRKLFATLICHTGTMSHAAEFRNESGRKNPHRGRICGIKVNGLQQENFDNGAVYERKEQQSSHARNRSHQSTDRTGFRVRKPMDWGRRATRPWTVDVKCRAQSPGAIFSDVGRRNRDKKDAVGGRGVRMYSGG